MSSAPAQVKEERSNKKKMSIPAYHATNYQGVLMRAAHQIEFNKGIVEYIKRNKIQYSADGITIEARRLERILYEYFTLYARILKVTDPDAVWKKHTDLLAYKVAEPGCSFYWEILFTDPATAENYVIQLPATETSAHLPVAELTLVVEKLAEQKVLKLYTHVNTVRHIKSI